MTVVVATRALTKAYRGQTAVSDVSFAIGAGESVGLVGPNGAGKSTLLRLICGSLRPTSGTIELVDVAATKSKGPGRLLGFVFDPPGIPGSMSAQELLSIEAISQRLPSAAVDEAAGAFEIGDFLKRPFGKLSTGQRQRVALAAATLSDPQVLILDEPTNGLDIEAIHWLRLLIDNRTAKGLTSIVSSHNLLELDRMTSRTLVLQRRLLFDGANLDGEDHYFSLIGATTGADCR